MDDYCDPIECNSKGLNCFAAGDPKAADVLLRKAYRNLAYETGILVNLGLALMQQGLVDQAERAYRLALQSEQRHVRRSAARILGFYCSGAVTTNRAGTGMASALRGKTLKPTSGVVIRLTAKHSPFGMM